MKGKAPGACGGFSKKGFGQYGRRFPASAIPAEALGLNYLDARI